MECFPITDVRIRRYSFAQIVFAIVLFFASSEHSLLADGNENVVSEKRTVEHQQKLEIKTGLGSESLVQLIDVGVVPFGSQQKVNIEVHNDTVENIEFVDYNASCGCTKVEIPKQVLTPGGVTNLAVSFPSPSRNEFRLNYPYNVRINCKGYLQEIYLKFKVTLDSFAMFAVDDFTIRKIDGVDDVLGSRRQFKIPVLYSENIGVRSLTIESTEDLKLSDIKVIEESGAAAVSFSLDAALLPPEGLVGELILKSAGLKSEDRIPLYVRYAHSVEISPPKILLSQKSKDTYSGTSFLKFETAESIPDDTELSVKPTVSNSKDGIRISCSFDRLTSKLYRVTWSASGLPNELQNFEANISVAYGRINEVLTIPVAVFH